MKFLKFLVLTLLSFAVMFLDQWTKCLTIARIALHEKVKFLPGFLGLTYERNTGAAFSLLQGMGWLFVVLFLVLTVVLVWEYFKKKLPFTNFERVCIALIYGGGLGNMFCRVFRGYVVDMIETEFMKFPVFNVADCFVCVGCALLLISLLFVNKDFWKKDGEEEPQPEEGQE